MTAVESSHTMSLSGLSPSVGLVTLTFPFLDLTCPHSHGLGLKRPVTAADGRQATTLLSRQAGHFDGGGRWAGGQVTTWRAAEGRRAGMVHSGGSATVVAGGQAGLSTWALHLHSV